LEKRRNMMKNQRQKESRRNGEIKSIRLLKLKKLLQKKLKLDSRRRLKNNVLKKSE
jgi:hypothetical protein